MQRLNSLDLRATVVANLLVIAVTIYAWAIHSLDKDLYYLTVQEDEYLEWMSFWAFFVAGLVYLRKALDRGFSLRADWCLLGLATFCLFVAFEEISWGQRIFSYRPPEYFLEANYQQELNLHNVIDSGLRKSALRLVVFGYGVVLPAAMLVPVFASISDRLGVIAPPASLIPAFLATGVMQAAYPVKFTGEWVELMLGLCFLFAALAISTTDRLEQHARQMGPANVGIVSLMITLLGIASSAAISLERGRDPGNLAAARIELEALQRDFTSGRIKSRCGVHKRLYTFAEQYGQRHLFDGEFARLTIQGLPDERAAFLLDPWNYAYWIRDNCKSEGQERMTYLYSFGPNQRRDSTKWEVRGDDIAVFVRGAR